MFSPGETNPVDKPTLVPDSPAGPLLSPTELLAGPPAPPLGIWGHAHVQPGVGSYSCSRPGSCVMGGRRPSNQRTRWRHRCRNPGACRVCWARSPLQLQSALAAMHIRSSQLPWEVPFGTDEETEARKMSVPLSKVISHSKQGLKSKPDLLTPSPVLLVETIRAVLKYTWGSSF